MTVKYFEYKKGLICPKCEKPLEPYPQMTTKPGQAVYKCATGCNGVFEDIEGALKSYGE